ncbi:DegT/DnrJ/EryC1/StrS family aminotransferase [Actinomadura graeca]|uniref:DegT/DnrJ/EryC1/StrS family aminotransferase n=1 Tax=Actinomadura graeca TaxID=2750812 RepID=A0ABX8QU78_9ACTN|nr:DegT/DnrJ/EryC1/StrS family aminotransferase [Actinomadura graeca]QXJ22375.1 DegT/DnrJ/EryC1/StrS family aminotransferase [Actinomadura graeca]
MDPGQRRWPPEPDDGELKLLTEVARSRQWTDGPWTAEVERRMERLTGAPHAVAFNSCTSALHAALHAMGCVRGTRVAVPALTFAGTTTGAAHIGADLVFADVRPGSLTIGTDVPDADLVIAVDLHGVPHGLDREAVAGRPVLTDACQSIGSTLDGRHVGATGTHAWSFSSAKLIAAPDGGAVTTDDAGIAGRLRELRDYGVPAGGSRSNSAVIWAGGHNWRPTELTMAMVAHRLERLDRWAERARQVTERVHRTLDGAGLWRQSAGEAARPAWHKIRFGAPGWDPGRADGIERSLNEAGVPTHRWGLVPLHRHPAFGGGTGGTGSGGLPVTEAAAAGTLCLGTEAVPPMTWTDDEVEQVCRILETTAGS